MTHFWPFLQHNLIRVKNTRQPPPRCTVTTTRMLSLPEGLAWKTGRLSSRMDTGSAVVVNMMIVSTSNIYIYVPEAIFRKYPLLGEKTSWNKCYWLTEFRNDMGYLSFSIQLTTIMKIPTPGYQMSHDIFINIFTRSSLPRLKSRPYSPKRF